MTTKALSCIVSLLCFASSITSAQVVWNFTSGDGAPSTSPINITVGAITAGNVAGGNIAFNSTSSSSGYSGASGGNNAAVRTVEISQLDTSISTYFEFTVTPSADHQIYVNGLTLGSRSTPTGASSLSLLSSQDNYSTALSTIESSTSGNWGNLSFGSITLTSAIGTPLTFRIYAGVAGTAGSANWRIDDVTLNVTAIAVPEPSTYAAIFGGVALVGVAVMRRRKRTTIT